MSVVPLAALAARPLARLLRPPPEVEVAAGCFLIAGGLVGLAIPPSAHLAWTIAPQALVGLGLGLTVDRLTSQAMEMRLPRVRHAGWTISARHVGVVVGLAILTPVFTADLRDAEVPAQEAITSLVLDAPLKPEDKIAIAEALGRELAEQEGQVPDLHRAFATAGPRPRGASRRGPARARPRRPAGARRHAGLPRLVPHRRRPRAPRPAHRGRAAQADGRHDRRLAAWSGCRWSRWSLVGGVLGVQVANGGGTFEPLQPGRPVRRARPSSRRPRASTPSPSVSCCSASTAPPAASDVSREALTLELAQPGTRTDAQVDALREGLLAAVQRMKDDGTLPPASELVDEALDNADLNGFLEAAIRALPDSVDQRGPEDRRRPHPRDRGPRPARHPGEHRRPGRPRRSRSRPRSTRRSRTPSPPAPRPAVSRVRQSQKTRSTTARARRVVRR